MELPILLAADTTENWNSSDTVLGVSELAIEIAGEKNGKPIKCLLVGDGKPVGPDGAGTNGRLRATAEIIDIFLDDTLKGNGTKEEPFSVIPGSLSGINTFFVIDPDDVNKSFKLPDDFMFSRLSLIQINGLGQLYGVDYVLDSDKRLITLTETPEKNDRIVIFYTAKQE